MNKPKRKYQTLNIKHRNKKTKTWKGNKKERKKSEERKSEKQTPHLLKKNTHCPFSLRRREEEKQPLKYLTNG